MTRLESSITEIISKKLHNFTIAKSYHMGYPYNLSFENSLLSVFQNFLINNLGDPYIGSHYATSNCDLEQEVMAFFMDIWQCNNTNDFWGYVGASGTEGNIWGLYLARENLADAILIYSSDAHYSIRKAANLLRMPSVCVPADKSGAISIQALHEVLDTITQEKVILALTCGTTMKGAYDSIYDVVNILQQNGYSREQWYIHCDGALNAMVIPFLANAPPGLIPSFQLPIDSISTSGHKMIGVPMPCGILLSRKEYIEKISSSISYLNSNDSTLMGSRNGHAVLALWLRVLSHSRAGFTKDAQACRQRAELLVSKLQEESVPILLNDYSITVVFPRPSMAIVQKYQLACNSEIAHAIIMPNVTHQLINDFVSDYLNWWSQNLEHKQKEAYYANGLSW